MAKLTHMIFILVICILNTSAAPSDISKLEDIAKIEQEEVTLKDAPLTLTEDPKGLKNTQGPRQKRFYDHYLYGYPPINPVLYPSFADRNNEPYNGVYGLEDPLLHIYKRLQDIAAVVKSPNYNQPPPPHPPQFPVLFPVLFIPQVGCACTPDNQSPTVTPEVTTTTTVPPSKQNNSEVDISNRFPEMEDERQNWGIVVNQNDTDDGLGDDFSRPISFDPIPPIVDFNIPPPPVEHGSIQSGSGTVDQITTTTTTTTTVAPPSQSSLFDSNNNPSACDAAVLVCCHQVQITYDCFVAQGCPDPSSYGNPCDAGAVLRVIDKFQAFYGRRNG